MSHDIRRKIIEPIWTYRLLPALPKPPSWLVDRIDHDYRPDKVQFAPDRTDYLGIRAKEDWKKQSYDWIQPMASNRNMRQRFDDEIVAWIRTEICAEFHAENSGVMFFDEPQLPHTDVTRDYVLLYNLETGGTKSELCFWREKNCAFRRERALAVERGPMLELVDRVRGPADCWYLINTRIIHSVENVTGIRLNLQISFDTDIPTELFPGT